MNLLLINWDYLIAFFIRKIIKKTGMKQLLSRDNFSIKVFRIAYTISEQMNNTLSYLIFLETNDRNTGMESSELLSKRRNSR